MFYCKLAVIKEIIASNRYLTEIQELRDLLFAFYDLIHTNVKAKIISTQ